MSTAPSSATLQTLAARGAERPASSSIRQSVIEFVLIFAVFFIHAGWPVPDVNETHYLAKAKHYWNPDWCARDFFLSTVDAHQVFYWTFGWLSLVLPLPALAWCGRLLTWGLLAWSWRRLSAALVDVPYASVLSAALFVALLDRFHMAGEWVVGGVEAKGFAYVLVLCGIRAIVLGKWNRAWLWLGAATAFHALVGGWVMLAAAVAWLAARRNRPSLRSMLPALAGGLLLALPGVVPALLLTRGEGQQTASEAAQIYVFERLPHHLVPQGFGSTIFLGMSVPFAVRHALLVVVWLLLARCRRLDPWWPLHALVVAALAMTLCGTAISLVQYVNKTLAASILRFYWFRTGDVLVPLATALLATSLATHRGEKSSRASFAWLAAGLLFAGYHLGDTALAGLGVSQPSNLLPALRDLATGRRGSSPPRADVKLLDPVSWREACRWAAGHTPPDALFLTPRAAQSFRWYAKRAEAVGQKDIPQDARGIVAWWERLQDVHRAGTHRAPSPWHASFTEQTPDRLRAIGKRYGAEYVITESSPPLDLDRVNPPGGAYAIYRLAPTQKPSR